MGNGRVIACAPCTRRRGRRHHKSQLQLRSIKPRGIGETYVSHSLVAVGHMREQKFAILGRVGRLLMAAAAHRSDYLSPCLLHHALREDA